jgi:hypothetical protein
VAFRFRSQRSPRSQALTFEILTPIVYRPNWSHTLFFRLRYSSTVKTDTLQPVWNELWRVKNVPSNAELRVQVLDKDDGPKDDYIGRFTVGIEPGAKEAEIHGRFFKKSKGTFWLKAKVFPIQRDSSC